MPTVKLFISDCQGDPHRAFPPSIAPGLRIPNPHISSHLPHLHPQATLQYASLLSIPDHPTKTHPSQAHRSLPCHLKQTDYRSPFVRTYIGTLRRDPDLKDQGRKTHPPEQKGKKRCARLPTDLSIIINILPHVSYLPRRETHMLTDCIQYRYRASTVRL